MGRWGSGTGGSRPKAAGVVIAYSLSMHISYHGAFVGFPLPRPTCVPTSWGMTDKTGIGPRQIEDVWDRAANGDNRRCVGRSGQSAGGTEDEVPRHGPDGLPWNLSLVNVHMSTHTCLCACLHTCLYTCPYACPYTCLCICTCTCLPTCLNTCT